jgi:hypothetical protein
LYVCPNCTQLFAAKGKHERACTGLRKVVYKASQLLLPAITRAVAQRIEVNSWPLALINSLPLPVIAPPTSQFHEFDGFLSRRALRLAISISLRLLLDSLSNSGDLSSAVKLWQLLPGWLFTVPPRLARHS